MSPFESESRMAAQLAPFTMVELMPYFLNRPFSWAITIGEQSVKAIIPKRRSDTSGFEASTTPALDDAVGAAVAASDLLHAGSASAAGKSAPAFRTSRLPNVVMVPYLLDTIKTRRADRAARLCIRIWTSDHRLASRTRCQDET